MIVVIDGYNLLKQIFPHVKGKLEGQRDAFVRQLGYYKNKKGKDIKEMIVVFDAGPFGHASREIHDGVVVMFSGQKSSADDWIIEYVEKHKNEEILVVTMDRKIIQECERFGATSLSSLDFYGLMQSFLLDQAVQVFEQNPKEFGDIEKYEHDDELDNKKIDSKALDLMMEQSAFFTNKQEDVDLDTRGRKGNPASPSKKEKKLLSKLKKLH